MSGILLKNGEYLSADGGIRQADIAVSGGKIVHVGDIPAGWRADRVVDCADKLVLPGFVNAHNHAAMTLFRGYADDMALMDWLETKIWPAEDNLTGDDAYWGAMLAIAEMLRSGTTAFADMYFFMDDVAKAVQESGIRAVLARGMAGVAPNGQAALAESADFYRRWHGAAGGRITVMLGPHAPYTCPPDYLKKVVSLADELDAEIHIHLSETAGEVETCLKKHGKTPIALMRDLGVFDHGTLAAHCVHVTAEDIAIMKEKQVRVAHNPASNMKLASGAAPVPAMLKAGICVAIGTDGAASNNNLDLLEELRLAALLSKVSSLDPLAVPAAQAVDMATRQGAVALGLGGSTGVIAPGYNADITVWDMSSTRWQPRHDRLSLLTYSAAAADVSLVMVDGAILYENGRLTTIDEERLQREAQQRGLRLVQPGPR